jgi:hypothetical protein
MTARLERLRGALEVARRVPADLRREDAVSFLRAIEPAEGHVTVIWHSVMWQYLSKADQFAADETIAALGARATTESPVARLLFEPLRPTPAEPRRFLVILQVWPMGERQILGTGAPHGIPVRWDEPRPVSAVK